MLLELVPQAGLELCHQLLVDRGRTGSRLFPVSRDGQLEAQRTDDLRVFLPLIDVIQLVPVPLVFCDKTSVLFKHGIVERLRVLPQNIGVQLLERRKSQDTRDFFPDLFLQFVFPACILYYFLPALFSQPLRVLLQIIGLETVHVDIKVYDLIYLFALFLPLP